MSKAARVGDAERTAIMLDLVRSMHEPEHEHRGMSLSTVVLEEVAPGTGFYGATRWADVLALGIWQKTGRRLHGYEIKASRADLKKELADPTKHEACAKFCDTWTLVAWDESLLVDGIPEWWGICVTEQADFETRELKEIRKPTLREPVAWTPDFVRSMVRNAYEQGPRAAYVARAAAAAYRRGYDSGKERGVQSVQSGVLALRELLYEGDHWRWTTDHKKVLDDIRARLTQLPLADARAGDAP